jgi:NAD-dependent SIR2 family protein deacetylase
MCDMLIVLGTSLKVKPFCKLIDSVRDFMRQIQNYESGAPYIRAS